MEERVAKLEERFAATLPNLATKSDIADLKSEIFKTDASIKTWMIATLVAIIGAGIAVAFGLFTSVRGIREDMLRVVAQPVSQVSPAQVQPPSINIYPPPAPPPEAPASTPAKSTKKH